MPLAPEPAAPRLAGSSRVPVAAMEGGDPAQDRGMRAMQRNTLTLRAPPDISLFGLWVTNRRDADEQQQWRNRASIAMNGGASLRPSDAAHADAAGLDAPDGERFDADALVDIDGAHAPAAEATAAGRGACADDASLTAWIDAIVDHDERALAALYDATFARVYALVLRITRRTALAEEAVEDTYWQVWRQAPRFDAARGRVITWLLAMARSRAIDAVRRDERYRHEELPEDDALGALADADISTPPDLLHATRAGSALHTALAQLEAQPRQLVALAFLRGLTHDEIAEQTALPLGTVKSQIRRALNTLKGLLGVNAGLGLTP